MLTNEKFALSQRPVYPVYAVDLSCETVAEVVYELRPYEQHRMNIFHSFGCFK